MSQTEHEVTGLQAELDSLYSEILPVAQMSTEQRYLDCAVRTIATQDIQGLERSEKILNYVRFGSVNHIKCVNPIVDFRFYGLSHQSHIIVLETYGRISTAQCQIKRRH